MIVDDFSQGTFQMKQGESATYDVSMGEDLVRDGFQSPVSGDPNVSFNVVKLSLALVYSLMGQRVSDCFSLPKYRP